MGQELTEVCLCSVNEWLDKQSSREHCENVYHIAGCEYRPYILADIDFIVNEADSND